MKTDRGSNEAGELLNAVLADEAWQAMSRSLKREALAAMGAARRKRRRRLWLGQVACAAALLAGAAWWWPLPTAGHARVTPSSGQPASPGARDAFISEEQMLAMFPPGSCVVAEVDGHKELVFFDSRNAEQGFVLGGASR